MIGAALYAVVMTVLLGAVIILSWRFGRKMTREDEAISYLPYRGRAAFAGSWAFLVVMVATWLVDGHNWNLAAAIAIAYCVVQAVVIARVRARYRRMKE